MPQTFRIHRSGGISLTLPCYRWDSHLLWGLTLKMVDDLLARLR